MLLLESILVLAAVVGAFAFPSLGSSWFENYCPSSDSRIEDVCL